MSSSSENHRAALAALDRIETQSIEQVQRTIDANAAGERREQQATSPDDDLLAQIKDKSSRQWQSIPTSEWM
jgi:hypothetical protein